MLKRSALIVLAFALMTGPASALSGADAQRCTALAGSLPERADVLATLQAEILANAEDAEAAGEAWQAASATAGWSEASRAEAESLRDEFDSRRAEVDAASAELAARTAAFNADVAWFNRVCTQ